MDMTHLFRELPAVSNVTFDDLLDLVDDTCYDEQEQEDIDETLLDMLDDLS